MARQWQSPTGAQWLIAAGEHRATVVEVGGGIREYLCGGVPVLDGYGETELPPRCPGQVLAPWPNRIGDGRYTWEGSERALPLDEVERRNAIHGLTRWLPWRRVDHTPETVTVACTLAPQPGYPHALELVTRWTVGPDGLRADHTAANLGSLPAPFGLGVHPYLRAGDVPLSALTLRLPAATRLLVDDRLLPVGSEPVDGTPYDFRTARPVDVPLDTAFGDLERDADDRVRVALTDAAGCGAELWMDGAFRWLQVYSGGLLPDAPVRSLAIEPMSCPPDAFRSGVDVVRLAGGERWRGSWGVRPLR